jgi:TetR/AcrR family transcriptional regulator, repressor of fatR-cypB operon
MARTRQSAARRLDTDSGEKREAILKAAVELFSERGFHGTAVPLVAERAGVAIGTIYLYFKDKEALVNAVFQHWKTQFGAMLVQDYNAESPVREQFRVLWRNVVAFAAEHPEAVLFLEAHHHSPYLDKESQALEASVRGPIIELLKETSRKGVTKEMPPELLLAVVLGAAVGVLKEAWQGRLQLTPEVLAHAEVCCWDAIRR